MALEKCQILLANAVAPKLARSGAVGASHSQIRQRIPYKDGLCDATRDGTGENRFAGFLEECGGLDQGKRLF